VTTGEVQVGPARGVQPFLGIVARLGEGGPDPGREFGEGLLYHLEHEGGLVMEVRVDRGRCDPGLAGDGTQRHGAFVAVGAEQFGRGGQNLGTESVSLTATVPRSGPGRFGGRGHGRPGSGTMTAKLPTTVVLLMLLPIRRFG